MNWLRQLWPRRILLFCDYYVDPIWTYRKRRGLPLDALPLSDTTKDALKGWAARYDELNDPAATTWLDPIDEDAIDQDFEREGRRLWRTVQEELGPTWKVRYLSESEERVLW
jgi:hypothetical protein